MQRSLAIKKTLFHLGDEETFAGYDRPGQRWNGFACPLFPLETVRQIAALTRKYAAEMPGEDIEIISIDADGNVWNTCGDYKVREVPHETEHGPLFSIGSYGWIWAEVEGDSQ